MNKKGDIEISYNMMYIALLGGVFLLLFFMAANWVKNLGEQKTTSTALLGISNSFVSLSTASDVFHEGEFAKVPIKISCDKFSASGLTKSFGNLIIFSPNLLKDGRYLAVILPWHAPFEVVNFLYIAHPELRYVLIDKKVNSDLTKLHDRILKIIPDSFKEANKMEFGDAELGTDKNSYKVRLVYFGENANPLSQPSITLPNTKESDITKLEVIDNSQIKFYRKSGTGWILDGTTSYLDSEMLLGAIFTEEKEVYECVTAKAFGALENLATITLDFETDSTNKEPATPTTCKDIHTNAKVSIDRIRDNAKALKNPPLDSGKIIAISNDITQLETLNANAEKSSCIMIY